LFKYIPGGGIAWYITQQLNSVFNLKKFFYRSQPWANSSLRPYLKKKKTIKKKKKGLVEWLKV
jgi:hypothetical protein